MPKIKINVVNGKSATPGVSLGNGKVLVPEGVPVDRHLDSHERRSKEAAGQLVTFADVDSLEPFQALLDKGIIVTAPGRPRASATNSD